MRCKGPARKRQSAAENPAEKIRSASRCATFGLSVDIGVIFAEVRATSAEVVPKSDHRGQQYKGERKIEPVFEARLPREMRRGDVHGIDFLVDRGESEAGEPLAFGGGIHKTHANQNHGADDKHPDGVVEKVHVHQPANGPGLVVAGLIEHLEDEARSAENESHEQRTDGARSVQPRPKNPKDEAGRDGRADISLHALQIDIELRAKKMDEGNPEQPEHDHRTGGHASKKDELPLIRAGNVFLVEVQRDHSGRGIEDRTHGSHKRCEKGGNHQPDEAGGKEIDDQGGIGDVAVGHDAVHHMEKIRIESERDDAGHDQNKDRQNLQEPREDGAGLGVPFVLGGKDALDDDLVCAPIPDAEDGSAKEDAGPRKIRISNGFDHVEVAVRNDGAESRESADLFQPYESENDGAGEKNQGLDEIGINDGGEPAGDRVDAGGNHKNNGRRHRTPADHAFQNNRRGVEVNGNLGEDVCDHGNAGKISGTAAIEAALEKLGHGENVRAQIERHENPAEKEKNQAGEPFESADRKAGAGAGTRETDEMFGGDVRNKQRRADGEPADVAAGQKIILGGAFFSGEVKSNTEDNGEIDSDNDEIDRSQRSVSDRNLCSNKHARLLDSPPGEPSAKQLSPRGERTCGVYIRPGGLSKDETEDCLPAPSAEMSRSAGRQSRRSGAGWESSA